MMIKSQEEGIPMCEKPTSISSRELKEVVKALGKDEWAVEQATILLRIKA